MFFFVSFFPTTTTTERFTQLTFKHPPPFAMADQQPKDRTDDQETEQVKFFRTLKLLGKATDVDQFLKTATEQHDKKIRRGQKKITEAQNLALAILSDDEVEEAYVFLLLNLNNLLTAMDVDFLKTAFRFNAFDMRAVTSILSLFEAAKRKGLLNSKNVDLLKTTLVRTSNVPAANLVEAYERKYLSKGKGPSTSRGEHPKSPWVVDTEPCDDPYMALKVQLMFKVTSADLDRLRIAFELTREDMGPVWSVMTLFAAAEKKGKMSRTDVGLLTATLKGTNLDAAILVRMYEIRMVPDTADTIEKPKDEPARRKRMASETDDLPSGTPLDWYVTYITNAHEIDALVMGDTLDDIICRMPSLAGTGRSEMIYRHDPTHRMGALVEYLTRGKLLWMEFFCAIDSSLMEFWFSPAALKRRLKIRAALDTADAVAKDDPAVCPNCRGSFPVREVVAHAAACKTMPTEDVMEEESLHYCPTCHKAFTRTVLQRHAGPCSDASRTTSPARPTGAPTRVPKMQQIEFNMFKNKLKGSIRHIVPDLVDEGGFNAKYITEPYRVVNSWEAGRHAGGERMLSATGVTYVQNALGTLGDRGAAGLAVIAEYLAVVTSNGWTCRSMNHRELEFMYIDSRHVVARTLSAPRSPTPVSGLHGIAYTHFKNDLRSWFGESRIRELVANEDKFNPKYVTNRWQLMDHWESTEYAPGKPMLSGTDVSYVQRALRSIGERGKGPLATVARYVTKARAKGWTCETATEDELMCVDTAGEEEEEEEMDADTFAECVVCMDTVKDTLLMPCRHLCVCKVCADRLTECPMCRGTIDEKISVFHS